MNSKLSAIKYILGNKKQVFVLAISVILSFVAIYITNFMIQTTSIIYEPLMSQADKIGTVNLSAKTMGIDVEAYDSDEELTEAVTQRREEIMADLKSQEGIEEAYLSQLLYGGLNGVAGNMGFLFPIVEDPDLIPGYLEHMGATLIEGKLPVGEGEILISEKEHKNKRIGVGDYYNENNYGDYFTIVGIISSDEYATIGTCKGHYNNGWAIVIYCNEDTSDFKKLFEDIGIDIPKEEIVSDKLEEIESYQNDVVKPVDNTIFGINLAVMIFLLIAVVVSYISFCRGRVNEYCLYSSIGYSRFQIYEMMMKELGIILAFSLFVGIVLTFICMILLGAFVLDNIGISYKFIFPNEFARIMASYACVVAILQIPFLIIINKIKTVDMIEE